MSKIQSSAPIMLLSKKPSCPLPQPMGIPPTSGLLPSEHAGRPHQNSALPPASITAGNAAAVSSNMANPKEKTPMCLVNELARFNKVQPEYRLLSEQGPAHSKVIRPGRWQENSLLERMGEARPKQTFTVQLSLGDQNWEAEGSSIKKAQHAAASKALEGSRYPKPSVRPAHPEGNRPDVTPTVELNALCMKLGRKPTYKALDPYGGFRAPYSYNMRGGGDYPPRWYYPFPVPPMIYQVELSIGGQQFHGKGRTRQAAKHDAAAKALKFLQHEPLPSRPEMNGKTSDEENLNKSEISQVFEIALKRNLPVSFEVTRETGPPHMKSFITKVTVGDFLGEGEGKSKKTSKKNAAMAVLQELKKLPPLPPLPNMEKMRPRIKKKTKSIVKLPSSPEYGQGMNPISRLAQIQQAKKEKEPEYALLTERGLPRRREFVMQVKVGNQTAEGSGTNKKVAKRLAAENMLELLGFKIPPAPTKPALRNDEKAPVKKPGDGRKVTFFEPGSSEEGTNNNKEEEFRMPYHQQLPAGILPMVPEVAQAVGANQGLHTKDFHRGAPNPAIATVTAMIARELLYAGSSPTAETILKNSGPAHTLHGPMTRPSEQLHYLSSVQGIQVEYKDFPKNNKNEFVSLINCSFQPPLISHGVGKDVESCHDMAALNILKLLSEMDQQSADVPRMGNGPMSACAKPEMESASLLKPVSCNTLGQTLDSTA